MKNLSEKLNASPLRCILENIRSDKSLKEMLSSSSLYSKTVFEESTTFVVQMQDDFDYWFDMAKCLFAGEYGKIDYEKGEKTVKCYW